MRPDGTGSLGRDRGLPRVHAVMATLLVMAGAQLVLLAVAVEGFLGGQPHLLAPAAVGSGVCCAITWALIRRGHRS